MSLQRFVKRSLSRIAWLACICTLALTTAAQTPGEESLAGPCGILSPEEAASVLGLPVTPGGLHKRWIDRSGEVRTACHFVTNVSAPMLLSVLKIEFPTELAAREFFEPPPDEICHGDGCSVRESYSWRKGRLAAAVGRKSNVAVFLDILPPRGSVGAEVSDVQLKRLVDLQQRVLNRF